MDFFKRTAKIDIVASSGILRVTVPPRRPWFLILATIATDLAFLAMIHNSWAQMPLWFQIFIIWVFVSSGIGLVFQLSVTQIIELDSLRLKVCKDFHGWERKREYEVADCSDLEWVNASRGRAAALECKIGWRTIVVAKDLSEDEAAEVLAALQKSLPDVAQTLCSSAPSKDHFLTLGLGK
jgi:hypothetical protein